MPTYNRAYIIERAIQSVQRQTYEDWELIIVDDFSTDDTQQILQKYVSPKIHYYRNNENQGANRSRNRGVKYAKGDFLAFLDSDNYWPDDKLEIQMQMAESYQDKRCFFYGKVQIADNDEIKVLPRESLSNTRLKALELKDNVVDLNTILVRKALFMEAGGFDEGLPRFQDWELVLRFLFSFGIEGIDCEETLSFNEIQKDSISRNTASLIKASEFLIKKYFSPYSSADEIIDYLNFVWHYGESEKELIYNLIEEISKDNPAILYKAIEQNMKLKGALQTSHRMETLLYNWQKKRDENGGKSVLLNFFNSRPDIQNIAIYGLGKIGMLFYHEVKNLPVNIKYGIDQKKENFEGLEIKHSIAEISKMDLIIITLIKNEEEVKRELENSYDGEIVTIYELLQRL